MTREERKKAAKVIRHMLSSTDLTDRANMTKDMVEACEMAIEALQEDIARDINVTTTDTISRQAAIEQSIVLRDISNPDKEWEVVTVATIKHLKPVQPEQKFSRSDVFEILHKIKVECWDCGMNMTGEYQGAWTRFRDIEKIIDKYMQKMEEGE